MARRTVRQRAAAARLVALNAARRAGAGVRRATRRVASTVVTVARSPRARSVARGAGRAAGALAIAQGKILPGVAGGYAVGALERQQRKAHAASVKNKDKGGALIKDPLWRLAAEAAVLAVGASMTRGIVRDAMIGASGMIGGLAEMYTADDGNPVDNYRKAILSGDEGI